MNGSPIQSLENVEQGGGDDGSGQRRISRPENRGEDGEDGEDGATMSLERASQGSLKMEQRNGV